MGGACACVSFYLVEVRVLWCLPQAASFREILSFSHLVVGVLELFFFFLNVVSGHQVKRLALWFGYFICCSLLLAFQPLFLYFLRQSFTLQLRPSWNSHGARGGLNLSEFSCLSLLDAEIAGVSYHDRLLLLCQLDGMTVVAS